VFGGWVRLRRDRAGVVTNHEAAGRDGRRRNGAWRRRQPWTGRSGLRLTERYCP
jgi:hypothetical protein